jgi:hypothetical protein
MWISRTLKGSSQPPLRIMTQKGHSYASPVSAPGVAASAAARARISAVVSAALVDGVSAILLCHGGPEASYVREMSRYSSTRPCWSVDDSSNSNSDELRVTWHRATTTWIEEDKQQL